MLSQCCVRPNGGQFPLSHDCRLHRRGLRKPLSILAGQAGWLGWVASTGHHGICAVCTRAYTVRTCTCQKPSKGGVRASPSS